MSENTAQPKTKIEPMSETNVGANLMFALQAITGIEPMFEVIS